MSTEGVLLMALQQAWPRNFYWKKKKKNWIKYFICLLKFVFKLTKNYCSHWLNAHPNHFLNEYWNKNCMERNFGDRYITRLFLTEENRFPHLRYLTWMFYLPERVACPPNTNFTFFDKHKASPEFTVNWGSQTQLCAVCTLGRLWL